MTVQNPQEGNAHVASCVLRHSISLSRLRLSTETETAEPSLNRRYIPTGSDIITTRTQVGTLPEQTGERLGWTMGSILLTWERMQGRYADSHAPEKRRRNSKASPPSRPGVVC